MHLLPFPHHWESLSYWDKLLHPSSWFWIPSSLCLSNASIFQLSSKFQLDYFHHCKKKLCHLSSLRPSHDPTSISLLPIKIKLLEKAIHRTFLPLLAFIFKPLQSSSALSILTPGAMKLLSSVSISSCQTQDDPAAFTRLQLSVAAQLTLFLKRYLPLVSVNPLCFPPTFQ